jgi:hypothetical protein
MLMNAHATRRQTALLVLAALLLTGCGSKLADVPDTELQDAVYQCDTATEQSPGFAISCDNYRRECKRRRDEGRFVC